MEFKEVAQVFEAISAVKGRLEITRLLADLLKQATVHEATIICNLSLGLLRPPYQGTQFNFAEKNLIKVVAQLLDDSSEKVAKEVKKVGDLGLVVQTGNWRPRHHLTVMTVYERLCALEQISGVGSQEEKSAHALKLLQELDPLSGKYVIRIMLDTLRLGFSDMTIIDALSWMEAGDKSLRAPLEHAYNLCADIGFIAAELKHGGIKAIEKMTVHVGIPIRPAAAERLPTARAIVEKLGHCIAQPKLDGFRLQIHIKKRAHKTEIHFFSRNLQDMSSMFPDLVKEVSKLDVKDLICEGEAIAYDEETGSYLRFQETVKRKRKHGIEEAAAEYPLHVSIFDLLYLDGHSYMEKTHKERREQLLDLFKGFKSHTIKVIEEKKIDTAKELELYFKENIASGLEGLVVKKPTSVYQPGKRNFNWIKLKREEEGHLNDTIDCVIVGYYAGSGKRAHFGIGAFLVAVYNKTKDSFQTVAKIGTGLSDDEWKALRKKGDQHAVSTKPLRVECAKELYPDVWVSPSIVCMIRADEITESPVHSAGKTDEQLGLALRFPRFMGYRPDKGPDDATTVKELKELHKMQFSSAS
jgi:DNA ligase-1